MTKPVLDRKAAILDAAADLFMRQGYHMTTMQQIADEIGILKGSLYHHYRSKQEILFAMTRDPLKRLVDEVSAVARADLSFEEKVRAAIEGHVRALAQNYPHLMAITAERDDSLPAGMRDEVMDLRRTYQSAWVSMLSAGRRAGVVRREMPPKLLANYVLGSMNWMYRWYDPTGSASPSQVAGVLAELVLHGVSADAVVAT